MTADIRLSHDTVYCHLSFVYYLLITKNSLLIEGLRPSACPNQWFSLLEVPAKAAEMLASFAGYGPQLWNTVPADLRKQLFK